MTIKVNKFMLYGGWEVRVGKNCARVLKSEDKVFSIRTDLSKHMETELFFQH